MIKIPLLTRCNVNLDSALKCARSLVEVTTRSNAHVDTQMHAKSPRITARTFHQFVVEKNCKSTFYDAQLHLYELSERSYNLKQSTIKLSEIAYPLSYVFNYICRPVTGGCTYILLSSFQRRQSDTMDNTIHRDTSQRT